MAHSAVPAGVHYDLWLGPFRAGTSRVLSNRETALMFPIVPHLGSTSPRSRTIEAGGSGVSAVIMRKRPSRATSNPR